MMRYEGYDYYDSPKGEHISTVARKIVEHAKESGRPVVTVFNDIELSTGTPIKPMRESAEDIVAFYHEQSSFRRNAMSLQKFFYMSDKERDMWMTGKDHRFNCASWDEGQLCCLEKLLKPSLWWEDPNAKVCIACGSPLVNSDEENPRCDKHRNEP